MHNFIRVQTTDLTDKELLDLIDVHRMTIHEQTIQETMEDEFKCLKQFWRHKTKPGIMITQLITYPKGKELLVDSLAGMPVTEELLSEVEDLARSLDCRWLMWTVGKESLVRLYKLKLKLKPRVWVFHKEIENVSTGSGERAGERSSGTEQMGSSSRH